jgi:hypothetical protein
LGYFVDLGLPGLVFVGLLVWLVRKVARAARTERDLESDRLTGAFAEELQAAKLRAAATQQRLSVVPGENENPTPTPTPKSTATPTSTPTPTSKSTPTATPTSKSTATPNSISDSISPQPKNPSPALAPLPDPSPSPLSSADLRDANPEHLSLISALLSDRETQLRSQHPSAPQIDILWFRSNASHCAWLERRHAASPSARPRDVICVARIHRGKIAERWSFG